MQKTGENSIAESARRLRIGILLVFGLFALLYVSGRLGIRVIGPPIHVSSRTSDELGTPYVTDCVTLLLAISIYWLTEALRAIAGGGLFSAIVVRRFRLFALWLLIMALFGFFAPMLAGMALAPPGKHHIRIIIDVRDLLLIGITLVLFLFARLLERARLIEDEMREIV
jgi:hypothetical protein